MNPTLLRIAQFVARRPSDRTIHMLHICIGLIIIALLWFAQDRSVIDVPFYSDRHPLSPEAEKMIEYSLLVLGALPIIKGLTRLCLMKHNTLRIMQGVLGFLLIIIGGPIMDPIITTADTTPAPTGGGFQIESGIVVNKSWHPGTLIVLLGLAWILVGLTGKGTTSQCLRYGEVVKKIRV